MKYLRLRIRFPSERINPVHAAICESEAVERDVLLQRNRAGSGRDSFLFLVEGDPDAYAAMLDATGSILGWELSEPEEGVFYALIEREIPDSDAEIYASFSRTDVVPITPITFDSDYTATFTLVGTPSGVQAVIEDLPDDLDTEVVRIGEYDRRQELFDADLTDRQIDAIRAGVACGYYDSPRTGSVEAVADALDVAPATAAEHLRKAENRVMRAVLELHGTV